MRVASGSANKLERQVVARSRRRGGVGILDTDTARWRSEGGAGVRNAGSGAEEAGWSGRDPVKGGGGEGVNWATGV